MTKKEEMYQRIEGHGDNLKKIFNVDMDSVKLCKTLFRLENKGHRLAEQYCNGEIDNIETWEAETEKIIEKANKILNNTKVPVFFNGDPRGYALKIKDDYVRENDLKIDRDWGGYGIIAPDLS